MSIIHDIRVHNRTSRGFNCDIWVALNKRGDVIEIRVYKYLNVCITANLSDGLYMHPAPGPRLSWFVNSPRSKFNAITADRTTGEINYKFSGSLRPYIDDISPKFARLLANIRKYGLRNATMSAPEPIIQYEVPKRIEQAVHNARRLVGEPPIYSRMDLDAYQRGAEDRREQRALKYVSEMFNDNNN